MMKKNILYLFVTKNIISGISKSKKSHNNLNENKTCVNISFNSENRMVYPSEVRLDEMDLIEFYLDGELLDSWTTDEKNTAYYNFRSHRTFFINPGIHSFEFKLYDDQNNYFYGGKEENKEIIFGDNYIHIQLERKLNEKKLADLKKSDLTNVIGTDLGADISVQNDPNELSFH